jgi:hypothetical protein
MGIIDSKSGTHVPPILHFQGFVEQEGKGRDIHTCLLPKKDTTKTWTSVGDIGSIPLDTYRERARKRRKKPSQSSSKPRGARTRYQSERARECECPSALDPPRRHNTPTNSVVYADCCRATGLGCPISQIWTRHRQDNLSVTVVIVSSSAARTKKSQKQD